MTLHSFYIRINYIRTTSLKSAWKLRTILDKIFCALPQYLFYLYVFTKLPCVSTFKSLLLWCHRKQTNFWTIWVGLSTLRLKNWFKRNLFETPRKISLKSRINLEQSRLVFCRKLKTPSLIQKLLLLVKVYEKQL